MIRIAAYTCVCEEDKGWIPQYLDEIARMNIPFAVHFDRCLEETKQLMSKHFLCIGQTSQDFVHREFLETDKQGIFDILVSAKAQWALGWDIDETWERNAPSYLRAELDDRVDHITYNWYNLWGDTKHLRADFGMGHRSNLYNLQRRVWKFHSPTVNGPFFIKKGRRKVNVINKKTDLVCLHHGMMTQELREFHRERWNRIYSFNGRVNPYGFWNYMLDPTIEPKIIKHGYI